MLSFNQYLVEKNTHLEHSEDFILNDGWAGVEKVVQYMHGIVDAMSGHAKKSVNITVKYDGAPAIFCGTDPADGKFFVGTKRVFNKEPVLFKKPSDIPDDDLGVKLRLALQYLSKLGIKGMVQGDFMFSQDTLKMMNFDGVKYLTFHPNTIIYAVPADSEMAAKIKKAKLGIVWHTTYVGDSIQTMKAVAGKPISGKLKQIPDVWHDDVTVKNLSGTASLTSEETSLLRELIGRIDRKLKSTSKSLVDEISHNKTTATMIKQFMNAQIKQGLTIVDPQAYVGQLRQFLLDKFSEKGGKDASTRKPLEYFARYTDAQIKEVFELISYIIQAKQILLEKLDRLSNIKTFIGTTAGDFRVTGHEGYVISDTLGSSAMKLVDRLEFSKANFSPDTLKGFKKSED